MPKPAGTREFLLIGHLRTIRGVSMRRRPPRPRNMKDVHTADRPSVSLAPSATDRERMSAWPVTNQTFTHQQELGSSPTHHTMENAAERVRVESAVRPHKPAWANSIVTSLRYRLGWDVVDGSDGTGQGCRDGLRHNNLHRSVAALAIGSTNCHSSLRQRES